MPSCMADDGQAAVFVGTFLTNGEAVALCDEHMVYFCASTLQDMTGVDPAPFIAAISDEEPEYVTGMGGDLQFPPDPPPEEKAVDPTPPTRTSGRMRAVSSDRPTDGAGEQDVTSDWKTAPADVIAGGPGDGSAYEDTEAGCDECGLVNDHEADCETGATTKHAAQVKH